MTSERRYMSGSQRARVLSADDHGSSCWTLEKCNELQYGAFAGAGSTGEEHHLTRVDLEGDVGECFSSVGIAFAHAIENDHSCGPSTRAAVKACASNSPKSSACSPMPMNRIANPS